MNTELLTNILIGKKAGKGEHTLSGSVVSFTDKQGNVPLKNLTVAINPVQDLHGYDNPWPAGGGKNKFNKEYLSLVSSYTHLAGPYDYTDAIMLEPNTQYTISPTSLSYLINSFYVLYINPHATDKDYLVITNNDVIYPVTNGRPQILTFTTGPTGAIRFGVEDSQGSPIESYLNAFMSIDWQIELGATNTSYEPYSNICPISGFTHLTIHNNNINQWDEESKHGYYRGSDGEFIENASYLACKNLIKIQPNTSYFCKMSHFYQILWYDKNQTLISAEPSKNDSRVYTSPSNAYYLAFYMAYSGEYQYDVSINYPSTVHDYYRYTGSWQTTYSVSWQSSAGTVYGGSLDVTTGVLIVDKLSFNFNGSETWTYGATASGRRRFLSNSIDSYVATEESDILSDIAVKYSESSASQIGIRIGSPPYLLSAYVPENLVSATTQSWKDYLNEHNMQIVIKIATPITYNLTPTEVTTLLGANNVWSDTNGDVSVTYETKSTKNLVMMLMLSGKDDD